MAQAAEGIEEYLEGMSPEELAAAEEGGRTRGFYLCTHQARPSAPSACQCLAAQSWLVGQVDFFVTQRRRAMACAVNAVGFAGHRAVLAGDTALATAALEVLLPHTLGHEEV
eukprot:COSAG04_NODE_9766_length_834_cov_1.047619_2_plen_111_part_01